MAWGDINRLDAVLSPQDSAYNFSLISQLRAFAPSRPRLCGIVYEPGFCTSYGWQVVENPEMGGQTEPPGMRNTMAIAKNQIGDGSHLLHGYHNRGNLTKRKQARDIFEWRNSFGRCRFNRQERADVTYNDGCKALFRLLLVGNVHSCDQAHGRRQLIGHNNLCSKPPLHLDCFGFREIKRMESGRLQGTVIL